MNPPEDASDSSSEVGIESESDDLELSKRLDRLFQSNAVRQSSVLDPAVGSEIGRFEIVARVGEGAFGIVYEAYDKSNGNIVALKVLRKDRLATVDAIDKFKREALATSILSHPGIVGMIEEHSDESPPYLVSRFIDGIDLGRWIESQRCEPQSVETALDFVLPLLDAVEYAHSQGVIHRDIKPGNVLLKPVENESRSRALSGFRPMLTDFGLAKISNDLVPDSRSSLTIGTPMYMAPEQLVPMWGSVSCRTDIYALGVLLAELVNGRPPRFGWNFSDVMSAVLQPRRDTSILWAEQVPRNVRAIIGRCLEKDPMDRYADVKSLRNDILAVRNGESPLKHRKSWRQRFVTWTRDPSRPVEVCFFVTTLNLIMFAWMLFNACAIAGPHYHGDARTSDLIQCLAIAFGNNLFTAGLCLLRLRGHRWATLVAAINTTAVTVIVPLLTALDAMPTFRGLYAQAPFFRITNHAQILFFGLVQSTLLFVCVSSDFASRRRDFASVSRS